jgi:outer membrane lipoprotein SlyB
MDEEPFEVFNVGDLKGYTYDQMLAVPQGVEEGRAGVDDTDTVGFSVNTEAAYTAVMKRFGDVIDHDETSGVMYAPARVWPQIEMVAFDADGEGAMRDEGIAEEQLDEKCWDGYEKKGMKNMFGKRVPNCVKNEGAERNELDTPAVQAALAKMAERHKGEKWSKEQLAALGKRIAARGQKKKDVEETNFAQAGEVLGGVVGGIGGMALTKGKKSGYVAGTAAGSAAGNAAGRWIDKKLEPKIGKDEVGATKAVSRYQKSAVAEDDVEDFLARGGKITQVKPNRGPRNPGLSLGSRHIGGGGDGARASRTGRGSKPQGKPVVAVEADVDEGWKSKLAGAALAGTAAFGGGAAAAHDHGDYGHYDQRVDDRSWDTAGYDDHIKSDTKLTKTTTPDGQVKRDSQNRISSVQGPNAQGEYRVFVGQNGKIVSSYITKTPPQNWMVKEDVTKEDVISKLKAKLGDYLSDLSKEIKSDPDLVDKLAAKAPGNQMGPPVKTVTTDDGHEIQIHGNEDDGFRISIKNKPAATKFDNLDEAVMACEMYCARRRSQTLNADYVEEA